MAKAESETGSRDRSVIAFLVALGVLLSPALRLWAAPDSPWWAVYLVWLLLIMLAAWAARDRA